MPDYAARLDKLLARAGGKGEAAESWTGPIPEADEPILNELLRSYLVWEAGVPAAREAAARLARHVVDFNDLRVCMPEDMAALVSSGGSVDLDRAERLRATLSDLYRRMHGMSLGHLSELSKREAKAYLDSLEGIPPYVSARVALLSLDVHAMPVDGRLCRKIVEAGVMASDTTPDEAAETIQRRVKAGELLGVYQFVQAWADADGEGRRS